MRKRVERRRDQATGRFENRTGNVADAAAGPAEGGADRLEEAVDAVVSKKSDELAVALMEAALEGNVGCAKMLVTLSERRREERKEEERQRKAKEMDRMPSLADILEAQPEWVEPEDRGPWARDGGPGTGWRGGPA